MDVVIVSFRLKRPPTHHSLYRLPSVQYISRRLVAGPSGKPRSSRYNRRSRTEQTIDKTFGGSYCKPTPLLLFSPNNGKLVDFYSVAGLA